MDQTDQIDKENLAPFTVSRKPFLMPYAVSRAPFFYIISGMSPARIVSLAGKKLLLNQRPVKRFSTYRMIELFLRRFSADCGLTASDDFGGHKLQALSDMLL